MKEDYASFMNFLGFRISLNLIKLLLVNLIKLLVRKPHKVIDNKPHKAPVNYKLERFDGFKENSQTEK